MRERRSQAVRPASVRRSCNHVLGRLHRRPRRCDGLGLRIGRLERDRRMSSSRRGLSLSGAAATRSRTETAGASTAASGRGRFFALTRDPPAEVAEWMTGRSSMPASSMRSNEQRRPLARRRRRARCKHSPTDRRERAARRDRHSSRADPAWRRRALVREPGGDSVELEPIEVVQSGRLTDLRFNVVK